MTHHNTPGEARATRDAMKGGCRAIIMAAHMPEDAKARMIEAIDEAIDDGCHDEISALEDAEAERETKQWFEELAADIRYYERRVL